MGESRETRSVEVEGERGGGKGGEGVLPAWESEEPKRNRFIWKLLEGKSGSAN